MKKQIEIKNLPSIARLQRFFTLINFVIIFIVLSSLATATYFFFEVGKSKSEILILNQKIEGVSKELTALRNEDQYKINQELKDKISKTESAYKNTASSYEKILDLKAQKVDTIDLDKNFVGILNDLSALNYTSASAKLTTMNAEIQKKYATIAAPTTSGGAPTVATTVSNTPPGSGYSFQAVKTDSGTFNVAIVAANASTTRVIIDTASDGDCKDNCPVLPLATYVSRSGAFAGINGSFFCPADYPSCAGKTNSFDTLLMNKNKVYFNSENNKYSTVPLAYFNSSGMGLRGQTLDWGRDTGVDGVLANYPIYVSGGQNQHAGAGDKFAAKGARTFVAGKGNMVYIGIVYSATSAEAAKALTTMGMDSALGLDQGGSTALWSGGYKAGPGRSIPNAVLFVPR